MAGFFVSRGSSSSVVAYMICRGSACALPQRMGGCGVQSAEMRLAASVWAGSTAALKQALPVVPQGVERLVYGSCLDMAPRDAQKILRGSG
eukprot:12845451-Alexandrium_andersonii.AAC.1